MSGSGVSADNVYYGNCCVGGDLVQVDSNRAINSAVFSASIDAYEFRVTNTGPSDVGSASISIAGDFYAGGFNTTFLSESGVPKAGGLFEYGDSFFVVPGDPINVLAPVREDSTTLLKADYSFIGAPLFPVGHTTVAAFLMVPAGASAPTIVSAAGAAFGDEHFLGGVYTGPGAILSEGLEGAFSDRQGGSIVLNDAIMLSNGGGDLSQLEPITADIVFGATTGETFATGTVTDLDGDGKYDIVIDADFSRLARDTLLAGEVVFETQADVSPSVVGFGFSITVPEPCTLALSGLALAGLVGCSRSRRSS